MRAGVTLDDDTAASLPARLTRADSLAWVQRRLEGAGIAGHEQDAEWLLLHALGISRTALWSEPHVPLSRDEGETLEALAVRRTRREPLQHLLGAVEFHGVTLDVEPGVFIPRPETELLVEAVLAESERWDGTRFVGELLDWGTGTGALAIALLKALPGWTGVAADRSRRAVALAERNAGRNGVAGRMRSVEADFSARARGSPSNVLGTTVAERFQIVVSNPPYVRRGEISGLMPEVRDHDPIEALDGGLDGLDAHRHLALGLRSWLRPGGFLALEIGADQADDVQGIFRDLIEDARVLPDWAGYPRIVIGRMRGGGE